MRDYLSSLIERSVAPRTVALQPRPVSRFEPLIKSAPLEMGTEPWPPISVDAPSLHRSFEDASPTENTPPNSEWNAAVPRPTAVNPADSLKRRDAGDVPPVSSEMPERRSAEWSQKPLWDDQTGSAGIHQAEVSQDFESKPGRFDSKNRNEKPPQYSPKPESVRAESVRSRETWFESAPTEAESAGHNPPNPIPKPDEMAPELARLVTELRDRFSARPEQIDSTHVRQSDADNNVHVIANEESKLQTREESVERESHEPKPNETLQPEETFRFAARPAQIAESSDDAPMPFQGVEIERRLNDLNRRLSENEEIRKATAGAPNPVANEPLPRTFAPAPKVEPAPRDQDAGKSPVVETPPQPVPVREPANAAAPPPQISVEPVTTGDDSPPRAPIVNVRIGRIEIRGSQTANSPQNIPRETKPRTVMSLQSYLAERRLARRGG